MKFILYIIICLSTFYCFAGTVDQATPDHKYIEYGSQHQCVLPIMGVYNDAINSVFKGSCVMIDEYHVLTAAHVISNVLIGHIVYKNNIYTCEKIIVHPDWKHNKMGEHDIAICKLSTPIELDFYPELYANTDETNKICSIAGYGVTGNYNDNKEKIFDNICRAGSNTIDIAENYILLTSVHKGIKTDLEFLIAIGDSGGGLFIDKKLAGIHSYVYADDKNPDSDFGDVGCHTRISKYIEWIKQSKNRMK